jgi:DNA-binding MarR family transcriptional regulator
MSPDRPRTESPGPGPVGAHAGNSVGFTLSQLGFETSRRFATVVGELDLEPRHFALLRAIGGAEGQSQQACGDHLAIPPSTMVAIVDHLEARGLLERHLHPTDRRTRTLHLTNAGAALLATAMTRAMALESTICAGLSPTDRTRLLKLLRRVATNLEVPANALPDHGSGEVPHPARS